MANFLCTLVHGPAWDDARSIREQDGWEEHMAFMARLIADGVLIVGGPVGDGRYSAHLLQGATASELRARLAEDPWATSDRLRVGSLDPWTLWHDGRAPATPVSSAG